MAFFACVVAFSSVLGRPVIKAFNNILAESLAKRGIPGGSGERVALSVAGDDEKAKQRVQSVIRELGFDAIDGGTLAESWRQQPGTWTAATAAEQPVRLRGLKDRN